MVWDMAPVFMQHVVHVLCEVPAGTPCKMKCSASWVKALPWEGTWQRPEMSLQPCRNSWTSWSSRFAATYLPFVRRAQDILVLLCLVICHNMHDYGDADDCVCLQLYEVTEPC